MSDLRDSAQWLAGQLSAAREPLKGLSAPQLGTSSIEAGKVEEYDVDGTLVAIVGEQFDGTHAAVTLAGPVPPEPAPPTITVGPGQAEVRWNGKFSQDILSPMDFSHVAVHASREDIFDPDNTTQRATISGESGDTATVLLEPGVWTFLLVAVSKAGKWSDPSDPVTAEVTDAMSPVEVQDMLLDLDTGLADVQISVDGKTTITNATTAPDNAATPGTTAGDRWQVWSTLAAGGKLLGSWRWTGTEWLVEALDPAYLPLVDIGSGTFGLLSGGRLVAKSVTADLLAAVLVLASEVIAGNPNGSHAKMTPTGFKVLASTDGNAPTEVVRMGTDTNDILGVTNAAGSLVASISSTGDITGQSLDVGALSVDGVDYKDLDWNRPWGLVAWASRNTNSTYWAGTSAHPYLHLSFDVVAGRAYRVSTTPIQTLAGGNASYPVVLLHYTATSRTTTSDPVISFGDMYQDPANTIKSGVTFNRLLTPSVSGPNALLLSCATRQGLGKITANNVGPVIFTVEDIGPAVPMTGEAQNGSADSSTVDPTPPPVVKNYDQTWSATGLRSFVGSGGTYAYNTGYMYSGLSPAGYGDLSSMAVFPSLTSTLSGATVTGVWVYVYYDFWYNGAGGDAYIGLHGQTGLTSSAPAKTYAFLASTGWPRAAGRWVKLPSSTYAGFVSGQHRGFTLGGSGGGYERYGYAHNPKIRITYTK